MVVMDVGEEMAYIFKIFNLDSFRVGRDGDGVGWRKGVMRGVGGH